MSRIDNEVKLLPSLLDRLLDFEPELSQESPKTRLRSLREIKQSLKRDLEWLLNTRCHLPELDERIEELRKSVLAYGMPDFTGVSIKSSVEQYRLTKALENAVRLFEPRLSNLKVTLEPFSEVDKVLKFRLEALLKVEPTPEPIAFDTVLQPGNGEFEIKER